MAKGWRARLDNANWPMIGGISFFVTVVLVLILIYRSVVGWLMDEKQVPLRHVVVTGQLAFTSEEQITNKVMTRDLGSFFNVDVNAVQQRIESLPWVYSVSVRKKWPDSLKVHVTEQHSVALWNEKQLLNQHGQLFDAPLDEMATPLPKLFGPQGSEIDALQGYRDLNGLLKINGFNVAQLKLSARFSWQLMLENGVLLELGTQLRVKRVQRFIDMYAVITKHDPAAVVSVDLRYDTGMAVRWADKTKGEKNS
jgi:cell division protein FtsQ